MADRVKIAGRRDPQANIFKLVHDWLCDCKQRWLLVLDNVDDARFLLCSRANSNGQGQTANAQVMQKPLREYLPHCERGSILVKTRSKEAALKLVEQRDVVNVDPMNEALALALFEKKLEAQGDSGDVTELAAVLEYMLLAIVQAAAYISQRAPRCSVAKYLEEFRKSERKRLSLLAHDDSQLRQDWEAKTSIVVAWQISFDKEFQRLYFRDGLRREAPREVRKSLNTMSSSVGNEQFEDDIIALRNFCFVSVDTASTSFEMHALVQLATRKWLEDNSKLERWKQQFAAIGQQPKDESSIAEWATVLYRAAWFAERTRNIADTKVLATKAMKARKKVLGQVLNASHPNLRSCLTVLEQWEVE
ncbi:hypothetical protein BDW02DRAFT_650223 [Decorospora gaudefroyi]|uniref:NB-ARC domain-containing protein n=1 Tax=Decorospora gaudefroyi TaxID=184978 RepID=A0A6A5K969_9PLEO|nr:hypothetical protein BDW02DRAFT_650223 [Decorospora gaudefroyi]